jgi:hypothetical protein
MLDRLKNPVLTGLRGYLTFSWDWQSDPLLNHPDVLQAIKVFNLASSASDTTSPSTPTALTEKAATQSSVTLSWAPPPTTSA